MNRLTKYLFLVLLLLVGLTWAAFQSLPDRKLHIKFYDVGQGDSIMITSPSGKRVLVDGGPGNKILTHLGKDLPFYSRKIDLVILTHPHEDHVAGLVPVVERYDIGQVWMQRVEHTTDPYLEFLNNIQEKKLKVGVPVPGDSIEFGDGLSIKVLWPPQELINKVENVNYTSIVVLVEYGDFSALLTGDAGAESQPYGLPSLWREGKRLTVLKVPHQGSKTGMTNSFLDFLKPEVGVIMVGKNKYGHPSPEALSQLEKVGTEVYRTDKSGSVQVVSDGRGWYTQTER